MAQSFEVLAGDNTTRKRPRNRPSKSEFRVLGVGDHLFKETEHRTYVYRVETGAVAVFEQRIGRPANLIEMACQGDYVGLGCLEQHGDNARAVVDSIVSVLPRSEFAQRAEHDPKLRQKQDDAIKRDFEHGKKLANDRGRSAPVERVAAFLVAVSRQNAHEGRDPKIVSDSLKCGIVESWLDLDISTLTRALLELQGLDLIEHCPPAGLHLKDIEALERIADGDLQGMEAAFDEMPVAGAVVEPRASSARRLSSLRRFAAHSGAINSSSWKDELREITWLASVTGGISVISVGLAAIFTIALL